MTHEPLEKQKSPILPIQATKGKVSEEPQRPASAQSPGTTHLRAIGNMAVQRMPAENHGQLPSSSFVRAMGNQATKERDIYDFSDVRIHKDSTNAVRLGALAYTRGNDIHFAPGQYNPDTVEGKRIIRHELGHVVQQRQGVVRPTASLNGLPVNDNPALESEADRVWAAFSGLPPIPIQAGDINDPMGNSQGLQKINIIQRLKIILTAGDNAGLKNLSLVEVPNMGTKKIEDIQTLQERDEIGQTENIIFIGHGEEKERMFSRSKVVEQGGRTPMEIAFYAKMAPKPKDWVGSIYLLGCKTGDITKKVSIEYYKYTNRAVEVIGTHDLIKVGADFMDRRFIGTEWKRLGADSIPGDLEYVEGIIKKIQVFNKAVMELTILYYDVKEHYNTDTFISEHNLENIEKEWGNIMDDTDLVKLKRITGKDYKRRQRELINTHFSNVCKAFREVKSFDGKNGINKEKSQSGDDRKVELLESNLKMLENDYYLMGEVTRYLTGLTLSPIDLRNKETLVRKKMEPKQPEDPHTAWVDVPQWGGVLPKWSEGTI
jgi:hypothetical protein